MIMYKEPEYAESRLVDTVVRWGDKPVYVCSVGRDMLCEVRTSLESGESHKVHLDELNVLSPPLGFTNIGAKAYYISRRPTRRDYRQGVRQNQLVCLFGGEPRITHSTIMKCIKGVFPSLEVALSSIDNGYKSVGISRDLCITNTRVIQHCWKGRVGKVIDGALVLDEDKQHLSYLLEKIK